MSTSGHFLTCLISCKLVVNKQHNKTLIMFPLLTTMVLLHQHKQKIFCWIFTRNTMCVKSLTLLLLCPFTGPIIKSWLSKRRQKMTRKITYYTKVLTIQKGFNSSTCQHQKSLMYMVHALKTIISRIISIYYISTFQTTVHNVKSVCY